MAKAVFMVRDKVLHEQALLVAEVAGNEDDPVKRRELNQKAVRLWQASVCRMYLFDGDAP